MPAAERLWNRGSDDLLRLAGVRRCGQTADFIQYQQNDGLQVNLGNILRIITAVPPIDSWPPHPSHDHHPVEW